MCQELQQSAKILAHVKYQTHIYLSKIIPCFLFQRFIVSLSTQVHPGNWYSSMKKRVQIIFLLITCITGDNSHHMQIHMEGLVSQLPHTGLTFNRFLFWWQNLTAFCLTQFLVWSLLGKVKMSYKKILLISVIVYWLMY